MSIARETPVATELQHRSTRDLIENLGASLDAGEPYDDAVVWELANRALEAVEPFPSTARVDGSRVIDRF